MLYINIRKVRGGNMVTKHLPLGELILDRYKEEEKRTMKPMYMYQYSTPPIESEKKPVLPRIMR